MYRFRGQCLEGSLGAADSRRLSRPAVTRRATATPPEYVDRARVAERLLLSFVENEFVYIQTQQGHVVDSTLPRAEGR